MKPETKIRIAMTVGIWFGRYGVLWSGCFTASCLVLKNVTEALRVSTVFVLVMVIAGSLIELAAHSTSRGG